jgi:hypothetical protein
VLNRMAWGWFGSTVLSIVFACPSFGEVTYSKSLEVPPLRISYSDLQAVLDKAASLMNTANGGLSPREEMELRRGELQIRMSGHRLDQERARLPQTLDRFEYSAITREDAPVTRVNLSFSDFSRTVRVQGQSPDHVDAVVSVLRDDLIKLSTTSAVGHSSVSCGSS